MTFPAQVHIRRAAPEDAGQIAEVNVRSWQAAYRGLMPQNYLDQLDPADRVHRWQRAVQEAGWPGRGVLVAADGERIYGFAGFGPTHDRGEGRWDVGELEAIYLVREVWGAGLGRRLLDAAVQDLCAARYAMATLWVLESNVRARRFYARNGWAPDGAVQHDESRGFLITDVRYQKKLPVP